MFSLDSARNGATALLPPTATELPPGAIAPTVARSVALSRIVVASAVQREIRTASRERAHLIDRTVGSVRMQMHYPLDGPPEIWPTNHWRLAEHYRTWSRGRADQESLRGIPKGLKLVGRETCIREFDVIVE